MSSNHLTGQLSKLLWFDVAEVGESALVIKGPQGRINRAIWGPLNRTIISAGEDSIVRIWDSEVSISLNFLLISFLIFVMSL